MSAGVDLGPHHRLSVRGPLGGLAMEVRVDFAAPWTVLFGPSGSGKSTLLRAMAGLADAGLCVDFSRRTAEGGWLEFDGPAGSARPEARSIGFAPQESVLFPHLDVRANLSFAAHVRGLRPDAEVLAEVLALLRLESLLSRRPRELSGGERQRVNVARALLVPGVRLLLFDEPWTGVDRALRGGLLPALRAFAELRGVPVISVTHEIDEPLALGAEVIRIGDGRVLAQGIAEGVLAREREVLLEALGARVSAQPDRLAR